MKLQKIPQELDIIITEERKKNAKKQHQIDVLAEQAEDSNKKLEAQQKELDQMREELTKSKEHDIALTTELEKMLKFCC